MAEKFIFSDFSALKKPSKQLQDWADSYLPMFNSVDNGLRVVMEASHSGIVNSNMKFYIPSRMRDGVSSFMGERPKKILKHHDMQSDPVGVIRSARYIDTIPEGLENLPEIQILMDSSYPLEEQVEAAKKFIETGIPMADGWPGLGYVELEADIIDEGAIKQVLAGLFDHVSTNFTPLPGSVFCSCGQDLVTDGPCGHEPGEVFKNEDDEDQLCVWIPGQHNNKECSLVVRGADPYNSIIVQSEDSEDNIKAFSIADLVMSEKILHTDDKSYFEFRDFKEDTVMKAPKKKNKGKDLPEDVKDSKVEPKAVDQEEKADAVYEKMAKVLGDAKLSSEDLAKFPDSVFCGPDRSFPVHDEAHVKAAFEVVKDYEGSDKSTILENLNRKAKAMGCDEVKDQDGDKTSTPSIDDNKPGMKDFKVPTREQLAALDAESVQKLFAFAEADLIGRDVKVARECSDCASHLEEKNDLNKKLETHDKELSESADTIKVLRQEMKVQFADYIKQVDEYITLDTENKKLRLDQSAMVSVLKGDHKDMETAVSALSEMDFADAIAIKDSFSLSDAAVKLSDGLSTPAEGTVEDPTINDTADDKKIKLTEPALEAIANVKQFLDDGDTERAQNLFNQMDRYGLFTELTSEGKERKITFEDLVTESKPAEEEDSE